MIDHKPRVTPDPNDGKVGPCIGTLSGELISLENPQVDRIHLEDISAGLSNTCRWGGQIHCFYPVARHALSCEQVAAELGMSTALRLETLHHDDSEAYLCDLPRPLKHQLPDYNAIERRFNEAIAVKFGLTFPWYTEVHRIDYAMLLAESEFLGRPRTWFNAEDFVSPLVALCRIVIRNSVRRTPEELQNDFIRRHNLLWAGREEPSR